MACIMLEALRRAADSAAAEGRTIELPRVDNRLVLCMIRTHRKPTQAAALTVVARHRMTGDIVLGPFANRREQPSEEHLLQFLQAHRWVMNMVHFQDLEDSTPKHPKYVIKGPPAITLMHRVEIRCAACGKVTREWKDRLRTQLRKDASDTSRLVCPKCGCTPVTYRKLRCTAMTQRENSADDPVIGPTARDTVVKAMLDIWAKGPPEDGQPTVTIPRFWCVYDQAAVPDPTWQPQDAKAKLLVERAAAYQATDPEAGVYVPQPHPLAVLPFGVARKYHMAPEPISRALKTVWLECDTVSVGWARMQDLYPDDGLGYRRQLWHDPKNRGESDELVI